jgi:hypothetical protein
MSALNPTAGVGVESVQRLVEEHHLRIVQQRRRDHDLAAHPLGVRAQQLVGERVEPQVEEGDELPDPLGRRALVDAVERRDHREVLEPRERLEHRAESGTKPTFPLHVERLPLEGRSRRSSPSRWWGAATR